MLNVFFIFEEGVYCLFQNQVSQLGAETRVFYEISHRGQEKQIFFRVKFPSPKTIDYREIRSNRDRADAYRVPPIKGLGYQVPITMAAETRG
jgi:hypothetical protein